MSSETMLEIVTKPMAPEIYNQFVALMGNKKPKGQTI